MSRSVLSRLRAFLRIDPLNDTHAAIFAFVASILGLVGLFLAARVVIDLLEVVSQ